MDEVDRIIVHSLKDAGCEIEDGIESLRQFTTEIIVEAAVRCLQLITPGFELSPHLPPGMTARFRVGSTLAQACLDHGFTGEIGYQTFLYWNETDIRRVLMFLIEKLPKETEKTFNHPIGTAAFLNRKITKVIKEQLNAPWLSPLIDYKNKDKLAKSFHTSVLSHPNRLEDVAYKPSRELRSYYNLILKPVTCQPVSKDGLACSLIETNAISFNTAKIWESELSQKNVTGRVSEQEYFMNKKQKIEERFRDVFSQELKNQSIKDTDIGQIIDRSVRSGLTKDTRFTLTEKLVYTKEESQSGLQKSHIHPSLEQSKEEILIAQQEEHSRLTAEYEKLCNKIEEMQLESRKLNLGVAQIKEQLAKHEVAHQEIKSIYRIKKATADLLPDAENNLTKLQNVVEGTAQRLISLASQWEKHRNPLIEQYRHLRELNANRASETQNKLAEIRHLRERMKEIAEEAHTKDELYQQLVSEYEKMSVDSNRIVYTRRIMEIVSNIKKQKQDIDKVLTDTKDVQKEINQLSGKLERTFTVTDELVFRDAKKDESIRKAYKYLAALHENCSQLVKTVEETGSIVREIRDLEDQIESESQKKLLANLERIMADYKQMKQENIQLITQLKDRQEN